MPNIKLNVLDDSSIYINRSIHSVQEHALLGAVLVTLIIFCFLRSFRSTLIVCTSIPISVIGTFALLYFAGYTLNIMTFGGLALGIGMVVDASIVVLENAFRHMEHGKDRVTAAIEGSEEVWGAIVASILTHIAVFVPLLFLTGISSILFRQLSVVVIFSLLMSLLVAVTLVPVLCAYLLKLPPPVEERKGSAESCSHASESFLEGMDDALSPVPAQGARASADRHRRGRCLGRRRGPDVPAAQYRAGAADRRRRRRGVGRARRRNAHRAHRRHHVAPRADRYSSSCPRPRPSSPAPVPAAAVAAAAWSAAGRAAVTSRSSWCARTNARDPAIKLRSICAASCRAFPASSCARTPAAATTRSTA